MPPKRSSALDKLADANTHPLKNVHLLRNIAKFADSGIELNALINTTTEARDAVLHHSRKTFENLATMENIERDAAKGDITLALELLSREPITPIPQVFGQYGFDNHYINHMQDEFKSSSTKWSKTIQILYEGGFIHEMNDLFDAGISPNVLVRRKKDEYREPTTADGMVTILMRICRDGNVRMFNMLASHNPFIEMTITDNRSTALAEAVLGDNLVIVQKLLKLGAKIKIGVRGPVIIPVLACEVGNLNIFKALMEREGDLMEGPFNLADHFIHTAFKYGHMNIVNYIIELGHNLSKIGFDILELSVRMRDIEKMKFCIYHGAGFDIGSSGPYAPFFWLFHSSNSGIPPNLIKDLTEESLLFVLDQIKRQTDLETHDLINEKSISPSGVKNGRVTLLSIALEIEHQMIIPLLRMGAIRKDLSYYGRPGKYVNDYDIAILNESVKAFEELLKFDSTTPQGIPQTIIFQCHHLPEFVKLLQKYGFNFNVNCYARGFTYDENGMRIPVEEIRRPIDRDPPLTYTLTNALWYDKTLASLLEAGCDPNFAGEGIPPLYHLIRKFNENEIKLKCINLLMEYGANPLIEVQEGGFKTSPFKEALRRINGYATLDILLDRNWENHVIFDDLSEADKEYVLASAEKLTLFLFHSNKAGREEILRMGEPDYDALIEETDGRGYTVLKQFLIEHREAR